jgi:hypothetical protein
VSGRAGSTRKTSGDEMFNCRWALLNCRVTLFYTSGAEMCYFLFFLSAKKNICLRSRQLEVKVCPVLILCYSYGFAIQHNVMHSDKFRGLKMDRSDSNVYANIIDEELSLEHGQESGICTCN